MTCYFRKPPCEKAWLCLPLSKEIELSHEKFQHFSSLWFFADSQTPHILRLRITFSGQFLVWVLWVSATLVDQTLGSVPEFPFDLRLRGSYGSPICVAMWSRKPAGELILSVLENSSRHRFPISGVKKVLTNGDYKQLNMFGFLQIPGFVSIVLAMALWIVAWLNTSSFDPCG